MNLIELQMFLYMRIFVTKWIKIYYWASKQCFNLLDCKKMLFLSQIMLSTCVSLSLISRLCAILFQCWEWHNTGDMEYLYMLQQDISRQYCHMAWIQAIQNLDLLPGMNIESNYFTELLNTWHSTMALYSNGNFLMALWTSGESMAFTLVIRICGWMAAISSFNLDGAVLVRDT